MGMYDKSYQGDYKYVNFYCKDYNKELKKIINPILKSFSGISQKDYDDFYHIGTLVVAYCEETFDEKRGKPFEAYFISCLRRKIKSHITYINRKKRMVSIKDEDGNTVYIHNVSLDAPISSDEECKISDIIASNYDVEKEIFGDENDLKLSQKLDRYLNNLSNRQKKILYLLSNSFKPGEIQKKLHITQREYADALLGIHSYENLSLLI